MRMRAPGPNRPGTKKASRQRGRKNFVLDAKGNSGMGSVVKISVCGSCGKNRPVGPIEAAPEDRHCVPCAAKNK